MKAGMIKIENALLSRLRGLATAQQWTEATCLASEALSQDVDNGRLHEAVGLLQHSAQNYPSSRRHLETALHLAPLRPSSWCALADSYISAGLTEDAREIFVYVSAQSETSAEILRYCASRLDALGDSVKALGAARRVVARQPDNAHFVYEFGYYLARSGATAALVISVMQQAISLAPEKAMYRLGLAKVLAESGDLCGALNWVKHLSASQLDQITCRCCLERLAFLYQTASDQVRVHACRVRIEKLPENSGTPATFDPYLLVNEYFAESPPVTDSEIVSGSLQH